MALFQSCSISLTEHLRYYILREPDKIMVPLVPVDQLPFQLQGIPRKLNHRQLSEGWKFVEETREPPSVFPVLPSAQSASIRAAQPASPPNKFLSPDFLVRGNPTEAREELSKKIQWRDARPAHKPATMLTVDNSLTTSRHTTVDSPEIPPALADSTVTIYDKDIQQSGSPSLPPSGAVPDPSKKEFCTHWIRTGECAFEGVGCLYKHEIPDAKKLRQLGFTRQPRWWQEKQAIINRGPTWMQRRVNAGEEENRDKNDVPPLRMFPDPAKLLPWKREGGNNRQHCVKAKAQHEREAFHKENDREGAAPPEPTPISQLSGLLISLDDPPSPASRHLSTSSGISTMPCLGTVSSDVTSLSPPSSPDVQLPIPAETIRDKRRPYVRRHSEISWCSEDDEDATPANALTKNAIHNSPTQTPELGRGSTGIAKSKHATTVYGPTDTAKTKETELQTQFIRINRQLRRVEKDKRSSCSNK